MKNTLKQLPWRIITILALIAFIRPTIKIIAWFADFNVSPAAVWAMTIMIGVIWIGTILIFRVKQPIHVLAASGVVYAWLAIVVAVIIQTIAPGSGEDAPSIPVLLTAGLISTTFLNLIAGIGLGIVARFLQSVFQRH